MVDRALPRRPVPVWESRWPGLFDRELRALHLIDAPRNIDQQQLVNGRLILWLWWPIRYGRRVLLQVVYPDSFPRFRPHVRLVAPQNELPKRHCSPDGDLCLLGRDTRQWPQDWSLCELLVKQLEKALFAEGIEDPQGEPMEFWWNALAEDGSAFLISSAWSVSPHSQGSLTLRYKPSSGSKSVISSAVSEVFSSDGAALGKLTAIPPDLINEIQLPWVLGPSDFSPGENGGLQLWQLWRDNEFLQNYSDEKIRKALGGPAFVVIYETELGWNQRGCGWLLAVLTGTKEALRSGTGVGARILHTFRAGEVDLTSRSPNSKVLAGKSVAVVGTGSIGAPIVLELARNGCSELRILDEDTVEPGNSVRWPLGMESWGKPKVDAIAEFLRRNYPYAKVTPKRHRLGDADDNAVLSALLEGVTLVVDASASYGVTTLLADYCREMAVPLISVAASPTLAGGEVAKFVPKGACPACLEAAWYSNKVPEPTGADDEDALQQMPGCADRTFLGAGYDLQELSLQAVRAVVECLIPKLKEESTVTILSFERDGVRVPPFWSEEKNIPSRENCECQRKRA